MQVGDKVTIRSNDTDFKDINGATAYITRVIDEPDDQHDAEVLAMYVVEVEDGVDYEVWSDEITPA